MFKTITVNNDNVRAIILDCQQAFKKYGGLLNFCDILIMRVHFLTFPLRCCIFLSTIKYYIINHAVFLHTFSYNELRSEQNNLLKQGNLLIFSFLIQ